MNWMSSYHNCTALLAPNVNHILLPRNSPCRAIHVESQILPLPLRLGGSLIGSTNTVQFMHWSMSPPLPRYHVVVSILEIQFSILKSGIPFPNEIMKTLQLPPRLWPPLEFVVTWWVKLATCWPRCRRHSPQSCDLLISGNWWLVLHQSYHACCRVTSSRFSTRKHHQPTWRGWPIIIDHRLWRWQIYCPIFEALFQLRTIINLSIWQYVP